MVKKIEGMKIITFQIPEDSYWKFRECAAAADMRPTLFGQRVFMLGLEAAVANAKLGE